MVKRSLLVLGLAVVVGLVFVGVAFADKEKIDLTKAGQAAARATVIRRSDLGPSSGWAGGTRTPDLSGAMPCTSFHPKQSDLVLIGAAQTVWKHAGLVIDSEAQVLKTPAMVRLDWQRTVLAPQMLPCMRSGLAKGLGASATLVSLSPLASPQLATYTRAYRALADVTTATGIVRVMVDIVLVGRGQTEITLSVTAPAASAGAVGSAEIRLAQLLVRRIKS